MKKDTKKYTELRNKAERQLESIDKSLNHIPDAEREDVEKIIYELQVHHIELELQNEELINAKQKLEESHQEYLDLFNFAPVGYLILDDNGIIQNANDTSSKQLNRNALKLKGENFQQYIAEPDRDKFYLYLRKLYKTDKIKKTEIELNVSGSNSPCYVLLSGQIFPSTKNNLCRISISDITKQIVTENKLKENHARLRQAQKIGSLGYWAIERDSQKFIWSEIIYQIFNRNPEIGPPTIEEFLDCCHPDHRPVLKEKFFSALKYKEPFHIDFKVLLGNNVEKYFNASGQPLIKDEQVKMIEGIIQDITDRKKLEQELREANATKLKFFSIISHDIKGPLNIISGLSHILSQKIAVTEDKDLMEFADLISQSSEQAKNLMYNLLEWARSQTGRMEFTPEEISVKKALKFVMESVKIVAREKEVKLNFDFADGLKVYADFNMLTTVLRNLISNAIKYSYEKSEITIKASKSKSSVKISVSDNGTGMKSEHLKKLFKIEHNISIDGTKNEKGTGLGLILSKELLNQMGGEIDVKSIEGEGSVFSIKIPYKNKA